MPYQLPSLDELKGIISGLRIAYKKTDNKSRLSCITLLEEMARIIDSAPENQQQNILIGALTFVLTQIESTYTINNPGGGLFSGYLRGFMSNGSELYVYIKSALERAHANALTQAVNEEDPIPSLLNHNQQFIYLARFFLYLQKDSTYIQLDQTCWNTKADLLNVVEENCLRLKKLEEVRLNDLQAARPTLDALEHEINVFCDEYQKQCDESSRRPSQTRIELINFMKLIRIASAHDFTREAVLSDEQTYMHSCYLRLGMIMYTLLTINSEYKLFNPEGNLWLGNLNGSRLFVMCEKALNISHLTDLSFDEKMAWLKVLNQYVLELAAQDERYGQYPQFSELKLHLRRLQYLLSNEVELRNKPGIAMATAISLTRNVVAYSVTAAATQVMMPAISIGAVSIAATVLSGATGPAGLLVLGAGTVFAHQLARTVLPTAFNFVGNQLAEIVGARTKRLIHNFAGKKPAGYYDLKNISIFSLRQRQYIKDFIEIVLALPDRIIPASEKDQIRSVIGMAPGALEVDIDFIHSNIASVFQMSGRSSAAAAAAPAPAASGYRR